MRLSIIIPVYKTEGTLDRCVRSIVQQDYDDWEAILVDDGSPDGSPALCDEWSRRERRIRVVHQPNGGLSAARNTGIALARGEYLTFVDSDDYLSPNVLRELMLLLGGHPDYDILEYSMKQFTDDAEQPFLPLESRELHDAQNYWLDERAYLHTYACNKIFRKSLFDEVHFPVGRTFEDALTLPHLLHRATTIATTPIGHYYYYRNEAGLTAQADGQALQSLLEAHLGVLNGLMPLQSPSAQDYYMHVLDIQLFAHALSGEEPTLPTARIRHPLRQATLSKKIKALLLNLLGMKGCCRLYRWFHRMTSK